MRKRRFVDALVEDIKREARLRYFAIPSNGNILSNDVDDDIMLPTECRLDIDGSFQQYGSFMDYDVLTELRSETTTKKARVSGESQESEGLEDFHTAVEPNSLMKLQTDYQGSGNPSLSLSDRAAVGMVPPPVP
ncbi:unnamed protein product [Microthlaspi erraticum]|uniref:Uncharacterized protein n=1 Tax=Microthlaspi erraticum TaxID=1685480 RepID=A0A6D2HY16_9BRAS|nr:unnamed protein product [Microthlaspi erraticum]